MSSKLELRTPTRIFIDQAKEWHQDPELNLLTGFGRGKAAADMAAAALEAVLEECPDNMRVFAVWSGSEALGYVAFTDIDPLNKTGDLHVTLAPDHWNKGIGPKALMAAVDLGMRDGLYRITFRPLSSNKRAISAGFKAGFKLEARTKFSTWTVDGPQDQAQMRVVKPEWRKKRK
jgi:RimJ/RimL family protein N-acetyltransferase